MTTRPPREVVEAIRRHRATADRVLDRSSLSSTRRAYETEHADTMRSIARAVPGRPGAPASRSEVRRAEETLRGRTASLMDRMRESFRHSARETIAESARSTARLIAVTERDRGSILHDDDTIARILASRGHAVDRARASALRSLTDQMNDAISARMRALGLSADLTRSELVTATANILEDNWWRIERTVRTETSYAFNQAQVASIRALEDDYPDVMQRWTEMVNDVTGAPLDSRVGEDSLVLHGQVTRVGADFVMPSDPRAPASMIGATWSQPPNRPNDRAVLMPWRRGWGIPAWRYANGRRIPMR